MLSALGQPCKAALYLRKAVRELPNLSVPWYLLGEHDKYELLRGGAFQGNKDKSKKMPQESRVLTDFDLLGMGYDLKYGSWYGRELVI